MPQIVKPADVIPVQAMVNQKSAFYEKRELSYDKRLKNRRVDSLSMQEKRTIGIQLLINNQHSSLAQRLKSREEKEHNQSLILDSNDFSESESNSNKSEVNDLEVNEVEKIAPEKREIEDDHLEFDSDSVFRFKQEEHKLEDEKDEDKEEEKGS